MKKPISKYIYLETEIDELRFVGMRISVDAALFYVGKGKSLEEVSELYNARFPPEAVAKAAKLLKA